MITRNRKTGNTVRRLRGRSGSMLLLVLVIMAVAIILITSALTITVKARQRFYLTSQTSQARLTATSTAMTIAEAIVDADFKSVELEKLALANGETGTTVMVYSAVGPESTDPKAANTGGAAVAPGLYENDPRSSTKAEIKYYPDSATKKYIAITVTTGLDYQGQASLNTESVTLYLEKMPVTPVTDAFAALISLGGNSSLNELPQIYLGYDLQTFYANAHKDTFVRSNGASNYTVIHGNVFLAPSGTQELYSDMIYTGLVSLGAGTTFYGNQVFSGDDAAVNVDSGGNGIQINGGNFLFLGDTPLGASVFRTDTGTATTLSATIGAGLDAFVVNGNGGGMYFMNTVLKSALYRDQISAVSGFVVSDSAQLQYSAQPYDPVAIGDTPGVYIVSTTGSGFYTPDTTPTAFTNHDDSQPIVATLRDLAAKYTSTAVKAQINHQLYTAAEAYAANLAPLRTADEVSAGVLGGSVTLLTEADLTAAGERNYTQSAYCINAASPTQTVGGATDQAKLNFDLINNDITIYIIGNGNTLSITRGLIQFKNGGVHIGRICLLDGVKINIAKNEGFPFDNGIIGANHEFVSGNPTGEQITRVQANSPIFLYIYGMNNNQITADQKSTLEGYIGLYGASGALTLTNWPFFYGRIESTSLVYGGGSLMHIPYSPSPKESLGGMGGMTPVTSSYRVAGYQYT